MPFNINRFSGEINNSGIAHSGHFEVFIPRPIGLGYNNSNIVEPVGLAARIESIDLPGRTIATIDNYYDVGVRRNIPYGALYQDLSMSIICSEDMREKEFFEKWQDLIVGEHRNAPRESTQYDIGYYDNYTQDILITRYRPQGQSTYSVKLIEAYPKIVNAMTMSWDSTEALRLTVSLGYRYFTIEQATNRKEPRVINPPR